MITVDHVQENLKGGSSMNLQKDCYIATTVDHAQENLKEKSLGCRKAPDADAAKAVRGKRRRIDKSASSIG